ncbi:Mycobacterium numidiamassiliense ORFan [Mycobacterium numidiamassiliense]|uniref:Mycobacterium numidiamassiliense ORFan n=1 Tax=Mycobacterium numidiamassiliense TaxID=1841861 RepID=A0A2U3PHY9_9MYCO|nr:Mycobacterium numidiamassiliense ORFan [Mycobacterium numidiamassiliense]
MCHHDPPLSMVVVNLGVNLRNFCDFGGPRTDLGPIK